MVIPGRGPLVFFCAGLLAALGVLPSAAEERLTFIGVALDLETRQADKKLEDYLEARAEVRFAPEELESRSST